MRFKVTATYSEAVPAEFHATPPLDELIVERDHFCLVPTVKGVGQAVMSHRHHFYHSNVSLAFMSRSNRPHGLTIEKKGQLIVQHDQINGIYSFFRSH